MASENAEARTTHLLMTSAAAAIHPGWVRLAHWINVIAMFVMITSGWRIYDASPLFGFVIPPDITIGDGLGGLAGALPGIFQLCGCSSSTASSTSCAVS
jgi:thiosulfate reductase cytochrome b subunit